MAETTPAAGATQPQFAIEKLYIKDLSLEVPNAPNIFMEQGQPAVDLNLHTDGKHIRDDAYHVTLTVTVTAKMGDKTLFLIEV
ncbi:MAG: protein-export chaperone SecB, partial [Betaproteobacteria bacterium]|nr:protein-export chaperone SecB [Betaproteobacteria bacterium]